MNHAKCEREAEGMASEDVNGYRRVRLVGSGSFGKAWLVQRKTSLSQYVMKEIAVRLLDEGARKAAVNEVMVLQQLRHPYIVRYRDAFCHNGMLCICMEYAAGGDLSARIAKQRAQGLFPEAKVLDYLTQLTLALAYLHRKNILHRDLKSQNVFLSARDHVKLGDFGISKVLTDTQQHASTLVGTPFYLSPEICMSMPYGQKSDTWALGCVLYELLTLKHAFRAHSISSLMVRIMGGHYPEPSLGYSAATRRLVRHLLDVRPDSRWDTSVLLQQHVLQPHVLKYVKACDMDHVPLGPHLRAAIAEKAAAPHAQLRKEQVQVQPAQTRRPVRKLPRPEPSLSPSPIKRQDVPDREHEHQPGQPVQRSPQHDHQHQHQHQQQLVEDGRAKVTLRTPHTERLTSCEPDDEEWGVEDEEEEEETTEERGDVECVEEQGARQHQQQQQQQHQGHGHHHNKDARNASRSTASEQEEVAKFMLGDATLHLQGVKSDDSMFTRLEALRQFLELRLGEDRLAAAYAEVYATLMDDDDDDDDDNDDGDSLCLSDPVVNVYAPLIVQLVYAELSTKHD
ncbi:NEK/NEK1 protein kinase [Salpingoeca rosetta]|uniref:non-specific serine/threonine protein kinase n=1 Tax=Salpingoeca rosetta (strain ATCC 50818 / BSB-021) TaxID=946362 RepID=F2UMK8_SALR5|nr:NEK/NEK1 protein kinase [Salpingoeca rosetta]EGD78357.1 NEK/NEK1 protein kinase [Salpingoeca rosetta]|eukprot:XP_004989680.1 NEK/NEK1 protein kinase [Salpingoeca rosetta]